MPHSPRFLWEVFFAQGPWLISYRKFLAYSPHTERKLIAQKLCLVKKDTSNDSGFWQENTCCSTGRKSPGLAEAYTELWARQGLHGEGCLLCSSISLNLSLLICQVLWTLYFHWASCLNLPSSKCYCGFVSSPPRQTMNLVLACTEEESGYTETHVTL